MKYLFFLSLLLTGSPAFARKHKANIDSMLGFEPVVNIAVITSGNMGNHSDSFSNVAKAQEVAMLNKFAERMKLKGIWMPEDSNLRRRLRFEISYIISNASKGKFIKDIGPPRLIDSVLEAAGMRYGLILYTNGFVRTKQNFKEQKRKGNELALATLGFVTTRPLEGSTSTWAMIIDSKEHTSYYYKYDVEADWNPLEALTYRQQIYYLFNNFFWHID